MTGSDETNPLEGTELREMEPDAIKRLDHVVYGVTNGRDVLQIGKGSGARAAKCMRGALAAKHNKAFICAVYETITGVKNRYFAFPCASRAEAEGREAALHQRFGITTNGYAACVLCDRPGPLTIEQVHAHVVDRLRATPAFESLSANEAQLAAQLFDLVTYGTTCVARRNGVVRSVQGDNLEGNILVACGRNHLIPVLEKLTDGYLRYGNHMPRPVFMRCLMGRRFRYVVRGRPFELPGNSRGPRIDADETAVDLARMGLEPE